MSYDNAHRAVHDARGPAHWYPCEDCAGNAEQWTLDPVAGAVLLEGPGYGRSAGTLMKYSEDIWDYVPRCRDCHVAFDRGIAPAL